MRRLSIQLCREASADQVERIARHASGGARDGASDEAGEGGYFPLVVVVVVVAAAILLLIGQSMWSIQYIQHAFIAEKVNGAERETMQTARTISLPQARHTSPFDNFRQSAANGHAEFGTIFPRGDHGMDLVQDGQSTQWGGGRFGNGSGHATAEELFECLDGARVFAMKLLWFGGSEFIFLAKLRK